MINSIETQIVRQAMKLPKLNPQRAHEMELLLDQAYRALQNKQPKVARQILQSGGALEEVEDRAKNPTTEAGETKLSEKDSETFIQMLKYNPTFREQVDLKTLETLFLSKKYQNDILPLLKARGQKLQKWLASYGKNYNLVDLSNLRELDLRSHIKKIPPEIGLLTNLQRLVLIGNQITKIPPEIGLLTNLQTLNLMWNQITKIPPEIGKLTNLKTLDLYSNQIRKIPPEIGNLTNLRVLYLNRNQITEIPPEIGLLTNLRELDLRRNQITEIPPEIGLLTNLQRLDLEGNKITEIPPEIRQLTNLQNLNLIGTQITEIPPTLKRQGLTIIY